MSKRKGDFTDEEQRVIDIALDQPVWGYALFLDYFCVDDGTGTWFAPDDDEYMYDTPTRYNRDGTRTNGTTMYEYLHGLWKYSGKPEEHMIGEPPAWARYYINKRDIPYIRYKVIVDGGDPSFFWPHGWVPLEWACWMHYAKQPNHTILGGFGSSKTAHVGMSAFVHCATVPNFKFICVASYQSQAKPMYEEVVNNITDTKAMKFVALSSARKPRMSETPNPNIRFVNGSSMLFLGADKDLSKIRSESADWVALEQAESHSAIEEVKKELGSRRRGRVRGRRRMGRMTLVANSGESPELWAQFDRAEDEPERYFSYALTSYDNPHLSQADIINYEQDVCGGDPDEINQFMRGMKPTGKYKDFPREVVERCQDIRLDKIMDELTRTQEAGAWYDIVRGIGHTIWTLPYSLNRDYAVYGDPGTMNPPGRGAGVVIVVDETNFPETPAQIVHFEWVSGNGKIGPWLDAFEGAVNKYHAQGRAYFEATGDQKNMDETAFQDRHLVVEGVNMSGGLKYGMKIKLLRLMERALIRWGKEISPIRIQLSRYDYQKDKTTSTLPQDIVTTLMIVASRLFDRMTDVGEVDTRPGVVRRSVRGSGGYDRVTRVTHRARR